VVSYLHPLHTEDIYVPARHGCVYEDVLAGVGCSARYQPTAAPDAYGSA
jgi:hypothetical protein